MIYRISLALLIVVLAIISTVNAFLSHGTGLVRFKAVYSTTRPFLSTSDDSNLQLEDELKGLKEDMKVLKIKREELLPSDPLYLAFTEEMTAIRKDITALRQQGTFPSPIPPSFPIPPDNILCPNISQHLLFTHPVSTEAKGKS